MAMRDVIYEAIMAGGATKESLLELTGTTEKGLASQFTYLRMTGKCPMKQEDGTYKIVSEAEWTEHRSSSAGSGGGKSLTLEEKVEKAQKRSDKASTANANAQKRLESDPDNVLLQLKATKAECELQIAEIELGIAETALREKAEANDGDEFGEVDEDEVDEDEVDEDLE